MKVEVVREFDQNFFTRFTDFRNRIHIDIVTSFPENVTDLEKMFGEASPFRDDYQWTAFIVQDREVVLAKAILAWRKNSTTGNLGYIDWDNNSEAATLLVQSVREEAKQKNLSRIKTPVDLNFYVKYRIRLPGGGKPVWGEPVYPDYYHDLFKFTGFNVVGHWDSYRLKKLAGLIDYGKKRLLLSKKPTGSHSKTKDKKLRTTIRCVDLADWDNELRIIHSLFNEAYQNMPEWEPVTFEQFKLIYDDFKYIINPLYCYIVELRGKPVAFSINYADPLPVLLPVKGRKLNLFQKALLLAKLRTNLSTFIIAHVGKIPGPDGEEIKGVQIQVSRRISLAGPFFRKVLVTFQMTDSPSRRSFEKRSQELYAQYVLYGMDL